VTQAHKVLKELQVQQARKVRQVPKDRKAIQEQLAHKE
jgi:hypothetical protein